ncbi:MAG: LysM peptidoglycan-binding domain-containing M23 family metallopeptidase [Anaerolineales bacterium]
MRKLLGLFLMLLIIGGAFSACLGSVEAGVPDLLPTEASTDSLASNSNLESAQPTPIPTRGPHDPGQLFDYTAQTGDTLPALASHFNTTEAEILEANPSLPESFTTLPPGFPLQIPVYYRPLTGPAFHLLPDSEVIYGPTMVDFDLQSEILSRPSFLSDLATFAYRRQRDPWDVILILAQQYSVNPRLLITLMEHQTQALTKPFPEGEQDIYPMGYEDIEYRGLFWQTLWAAERLNQGFYGWRTGELTEFQLADGMIVRPDPWLNAGTVAVQYFFAGLYGKAQFEQAVSPDGFYQTYLRLWGNPFDLGVDYIPANLQQPELTLPFLPNHVWDFTGGPHPSWGSSLPWGALDFAPPSESQGCVWSNEYAAAPAPGLVVRADESTVVLDLDGDGFEQTGWVLFYYHIAEQDMVPVGTYLETGDPIGHPSCEGGRSTGTHFHLARRYNGEWIPAAGPLAFEMDGWLAAGGSVPYEGTLTKGSKVVPACPCSTRENQIIYELE